MPTASEAAAAEARFWDSLAVWTGADFPEVFADTPPTEAAVVRFYDPADDLVRRSEKAGLGFADDSLAGLAGAAAVLARREADAWASDVPDRAMRAYHDRRHLVSDRIVHWAVPWLAAIGRCYPDLRDIAQPHLEGILSIGEEMRLAPGFGAGEGLHLPGEDALGPMDLDVPLRDFLASMWSGLVFTAATVRSMGLGDGGRVLPSGAFDDAGIVSELAMLYEISAARWRGFAERHPGTSALWDAMSARAVRTSHRLDALAQSLAD